MSLSLTGCFKTCLKFIRVKKISAKGQGCIKRPLAACAAEKDFEAVSKDPVICFAVAT
jgi:hypothetical protein